MVVLAVTDDVRYYQDNSKAILMFVNSVVSNTQKLVFK